MFLLVIFENSIEQGINLHFVRYNRFGFSSIDRLRSVASSKPNWLRLRFQVKPVDQQVPNASNGRFDFLVLAISCVRNTKSSTMYFSRLLPRTFEASRSQALVLSFKFEF